MFDAQRRRVSDERRHLVAAFERLRHELTACSAGRAHDQHARGKRLRHRVCRAGRRPKTPARERDESIVA